MEEIVAPDFGESVFEASVGRWIKSEGDTVRTGEPIVELHTDKAVQEINAVRDGTIGNLLKQVDEVVRPGDALCEFDPEEMTEPNEISEPEEDVAVDATDTFSEFNEVGTAGATIVDEAVETSGDSEVEDDGFVEIEFGPFVESIGPEEPQTAPVVESVEELESVATSSAEHDETPDASTDSDEADQGSSSEETSDEVSGYEATSSLDQKEISVLREMMDDKPVRRERLSRRRLTAARRMAQVQAEAVMTTTYNEVDMYEVIRIRREHGESFMESHGIKLGFMSFFVKAVVNGLKSFPILNSELDGDELVYKEYYDIGIAVASEHGLVVPVVREADLKSFADIEREIRGFGDKARTGSFVLADLVGGTFTITNGGVFGSMMSTPILNPPQVGILGMHNIVDRAVVVDGEIDVRPMMYLAVTYDHRVVEGAQAVQFLMRIKESLESAETLMLGS